MNEMPRPGEIYRHFKNKLYQIVGIAEHSENGELLVIYQALYGDYKLYARPYEMFAGKVDLEKYPDAQQKFRFERVEKKSEIFTKPDVRQNVSDGQPVSDGQSALVDQPASVGQPASVDHPAFDDRSVNETSESEAEPLLMAFLEADNLEEKYKILVEMRDIVTDRMIDTMAVVSDVVIPEGELHKRYDELKYAIHTRKKYEYSNRLR